MRRAMAEAEVGDDDYGEDPTVRALEETFADGWASRPPSSCLRGSWGTRLPCGSPDARLRGGGGAAPARRRLRVRRGRRERRRAVHRARRRDGPSGGRRRALGPTGRSAPSARRWRSCASRTRTWPRRALCGEDRLVAVAEAAGPFPSTWTGPACSTRRWRPASVRRRGRHRRRRSCAACPRACAPPSAPCWRGPGRDRRGPLGPQAPGRGHASGGGVLAAPGLVALHDMVGRWLRTTPGRPVGRRRWPTLARRRIDPATCAPTSSPSPTPSPTRCWPTSSGGASWPTPSRPASCASSPTTTSTTKPRAGAGRADRGTGRGHREGPHRYSGGGETWGPRRMVALAQGSPHRFRLALAPRGPHPTGPRSAGRAGLGVGRLPGLKIGTTMLLPGATWSGWPRRWAPSTSCRAGASS